MIFLNGDFSCKCYNFTKQGETYTFLLEETPQLTEDSCYVKSEDEFPMNLLTLKIKDFKYKDALKNGEVVKFVVSNSSSNNDRVFTPSIFNIRNDKLQELSKKCGEHITKGINVKLSTGSKFFKLEIIDQINLAEALNVATQVGEALYHAEGEDYTIYSLEDLQKIDQEAKTWKYTNLVYYNILKNKIKEATEISQIQSITYENSLTLENIELLRNKMTLLGFEQIGELFKEVEVTND